MELRTRSYFIVLLIIIGIILTFSSLLLNRASSSPKEILEECKTIENNNGNINLVFFSESEEAKRYSDFLKSSSPFNQYENLFNFFYIDNYKPECEFYKGIALLCYSSDLITKASSCPNDFTIVLQEEDAKIRSSAYNNVMSINNVHPQTVLLHELGHSLASLAEEYTPASLSKNAKNCVSKCSDFKGEINECELGCSLENHHRSINEGVMRTLSTSNYGIYNENLIKEVISSKFNKKLGVKITGNTISEECANQHYILYSVGTKEKTIHSGCSPSNGQGPNTYIVYLGEEISYQGNFDNLFFTDSQPENSDTIQGEVYNSLNEILISLPYPPQGDKIEVYDSDGNKISESFLYDAGGRPCKV
jgi:hypothetical protein